MPLSAPDRLRLWDAIAGMHPVDAAVRCLAVARPDLEDPAGLPLGMRDAALLELRSQLLGDRLTARATCQACDEPATVVLSVAEMVAGMTTEERWTLAYAGRTLTLRPLTSRDAALAATAASTEEARNALARAAVDGDDDVVSDPAMAGAIAESLAEHDSGSEITLACTCTSCGAAWQEVLDVARFVTTELAHHGVLLLAEVAALARGFGWSEDAILAMAEPRRRAYLALAAS
jgi:hypothetical protein